MYPCHMALADRKYLLAYTDVGWKVYVEDQAGRRSLDHISPKIGVAERISAMNAYDIYEAFRIFVGHAAYLDQPEQKGVPKPDSISKRAQYLLQQALHSYEAQHSTDSGTPIEIALETDSVQQLWEVHSDELSEVTTQFEFELDPGTLDSALERLGANSLELMSRLINLQNQGLELPTLFTFDDLDGTIIAEKLSLEGAREFASLTGSSPAEIRKQYGQDRTAVDKVMLQVLARNAQEGVNQVFITGRSATETEEIATQILRARARRFPKNEVPPVIALVGNGTKLVEFSLDTTTGQTTAIATCKSLSSQELESSDIERLERIFYDRLGFDNIKDFREAFDLNSASDIFDPKHPWVHFGPGTPSDNKPKVMVHEDERPIPFWIMVGDPIVDGDSPVPDFVRLRQVDPDAWKALEFDLSRSDTMTFPQPLEESSGNCEILLTHASADKGGAIRKYVLSIIFTTEELAKLTAIEIAHLWEYIRPTVIGRGNGSNDAPMKWNSRFFATATSPETLQENIDPDLLTPDPAIPGPFMDRYPGVFNPDDRENRRKQSQLAAMRRIVSVQLPLGDRPVQQVCQSMGVLDAKRAR